MVQFLPVCMCVRVHSSAYMCTCWVHNSSVITQKKMHCDPAIKKKCRFSKFAFGKYKVLTRQQLNLCKLCKCLHVLCLRERWTCLNDLKKASCCAFVGVVFVLYEIFRERYMLRTERCGHAPGWLWHNKYLWVLGGAGGVELDDAKNKYQRSSWCTT